MSVRLRLCHTDPGLWPAKAADGTPYARQLIWPQLTAFVARSLPETVVALFAEPVVQGHNNSTEWWSLLPGQPVPLLSLTKEEQGRVKDILLQRLDLVRHLGERYRVAGNRHAAELIVQASVTPGADQVMVQNGHPVIIGWGYPGAGIQPLHFADTPRDVRGRRWWLWFLFLMIMGMILASFLYSCDHIWPVAGEIPKPSPIADTLINDILQAEDELRRRLEACSVSGLPSLPPDIPGSGTMELGLSKTFPNSDAPRPTAPVPTEKPLGPEAALIPPQKQGHAKKTCPPKPKPWENPEVALLLDASGSMALSADLRNSQVKALMRQAMAGSHAALSKLHGGRSRLDAAKDAVAGLAATLPGHIDLGLLVFGRCEGTDNYSFFKGNERHRLLEQMRSITPRQGTPLARGLERAGTMLDGIKIPGTIVVVTDGEDSCGGDPCAVARALKARKPNIRINVINVDGSGDGRCMAEATGGKLILPKDGQSWDDLLRDASGHVPLPPGCE